jgi:SAM-dependent methyltransferase
MSEKPLGERNYEQFADRYAKYAKVKPHNALYERPATLSLLPDVAGLRVLDAGCGPGHYAEELLRRDAEVVAVDVTPAMVELARQRVGDRATVMLANLEQPLDFAEDASFDLVLCPLTLDYVEDWAPLFAEFFRVLRPGGVLVYSHGHPMTDYWLVRSKYLPDSHYPQRERFSSQWGGFGNPRPTVEGFRRPLSDMLNPLANAGFILDHLLEPRPSEAVREANPALFETLDREPCFLCVRAKKP